MNKPVKEILLAYLCDRKACERCSDECEHTLQIEHAIHKDDLDNCKFMYVTADEELIILQEFSGVSINPISPMKDWLRYH